MLEPLSPRNQCMDHFTPTGSGDVYFIEHPHDYIFNHIVQYCPQGLSLFYTSGFWAYIPHNFILHDPDTSLPRFGMQTVLTLPLDPLMISHVPESQKTFHYQFIPLASYLPRSMLSMIVQNLHAFPFVKSTTLYLWNNQINKIISSQICILNLKQGE